MSQNYGEVLCQAVDEIVRKRLEGVSYDQTILCTIVDDSKREQGIYTVTNNNTTKFEAFSAVANYRNKDNVYVQIPSGDWNQQKIIVAKKTSKNDEPFIYKRPFESLVDITGNLIKDDINDNLTGLLANSNEYQSITLWTYNINNNALSKATGNPHAAYTRLGIQAGFKSLINPFYDNDTVYNVTNGDYGLRLIITTIDEKTSKEDVDKQAEYVLYLNCADMNGNPYDFQSYYTQEKVFDISQIGKIQTMSLEFYQTPGTFKSAEGKLVPYTDFLGNSLPPNLFADDVYISLGYDTSESDSEMVYVYTLDSTTYTSTAQPPSKNNKNIQLRWIHQLPDGSFKSITAGDKDMDFEVRWYRYELGCESADEYSGVYWKNLSKQITAQGTSGYDILDEDWITHNNTSDSDYTPSFFETYLLPDIILQEEQIKAIIIYQGQPYRSNILRFRNEKEVANQATLGAITALNISFDDNSNGNYFVYQLGGSLLDQGDASKPRNFVATFKVPTETEWSPLTDAEYVEWTIPKSDTMIVLSDEWKAKDSGENSEYYVIRTFNGVNHIDETVGNGNLMPFTIGSLYSQWKNKNTISCKIRKTGLEYTTSKELSFGPAGTNGTDYTFVLDYVGNQTAATIGGKDAIIVEAHLYDYTGKPIEITNTISWSWKDGETAFQRRDISNTRVELKCNSGMTNANYSILQASYTLTDSFTLTAYLPIAMRSMTDIAYISGPTQIIYDTSGTITPYSLRRIPFTLYDVNGNSISNVKWYVTTTESNWYTPKIPNPDNGILVPTEVIVENSCKFICVNGKIDGVTVWSQPILIIQNKYPTAMVNKWDGTLQIDEENNAILTAQVVAGEKDDENRFTGLIMGSIKGNAESALQANTGLYGYHQGAQAFAFKDDGTGFIGKEGVGRITFSGDVGQIKSGNYDSTNYGLLLDFANPQLLMRKEDSSIDIGLSSFNNNMPYFSFIGGNSSLTLDSAISNGAFELSLSNDSNYVSLSSDTDGYPLNISNNFYVQWDGTLHANAGEFHGDIYADGGQLNNLEIIGTLTGGFISGTDISNGDGTFHVDSAGNLYAASATIEGTVTANDGQIGKWKISDDGGISNGATTLGGNGAFGSSDATITGGSLNIGDGQFTVDTKGNMVAESATIRGHVEAATGSIGGWNISTGNKDPITGADTETSASGWNALWASNEEGYYTVLDPGRDNVIAVGIPASYVFSNHNYAQFRITNTGDLIIGGNEAPFKVTQKGELKATSGDIGGWTIGKDSLSTTGLTLSASTSGAQLSGGSSTTKAAGSNYWAIKADGSAEFSNLKITGGEITITNNNKTAFAVTSAGELTATSGNIAGWTIGADSLTSTNITLSNSTTDKAKAINVSNGTFYVQNDGYMFASSGSIGGWTIGTNSLTSSGNTNIVLSSASTGSAIKVGSNFTVATDGSMTAKAGTIGGWTINSTSLKSVNECITLYGNANSDSTANAIYIKHPKDDEYFRVQNNGFVEARAGTIGTWNLSQSQLRFNNSNTFYFNTKTGDLTISGQLKASKIVGKVEEIEDVKKDISTINADIANIYDLINTIIDLIPE